MSKQALEYYQERASRLQIDTIPPILNGEPLVISPEGVSIPVHQPESLNTEVAAARLKTALQTTHGFLLQGVADDPESPKDQLPTIESKNQVFVQRFLSKLLIHKDVKTGKIDDIQLEALAQDEVEMAMVDRISEQSYKSLVSDEGDRAELYFAVHGRHRSGSRKGRIGGLLLVRAVHHTKGGHVSYQLTTNVHYAGEPWKSNDWLARESRAAAGIIKSDKIRSAYINAVGTRPASKGSRLQRGNW